MTETIAPPPLSASPLTDDRIARRNAVLLSISQAIYGSSAFVMIATGGLVGYELASDKGLATLPISAYVVGTACATFPASLYMRRVGRKWGFITGALFGFASGAMAVAAILMHSFALLVLALFVGGAYQAFAQFYRFAAADRASAGFMPKAVSWVMVGGIAGAFIGPAVVISAKDIIPGGVFAGCYAATMALTLLAMGFLWFIDIPRDNPDDHKKPARPLAVIARQPRLIIAVACGMLSYAMMNLVMTAAPLAMVGDGHSVDDAAFAIQWHVLGMFVPSFFTGALIARFGKEAIISVGMILLAGCGIVALMGVELYNYMGALVLLGLGWNFGFIGATTMVTKCYHAGEKAKVQGLNDFLVFSTVAVASLSSGKMLHVAGWQTINMVLFPLVLLALALVAWLRLAGHHERVRPVR